MATKRGKPRKVQEPPKPPQAEVRKSPPKDPLWFRRSRKAYVSSLCRDPGRRGTCPKRRDTHNPETGKRYKRPTYYEPADVPVLAENALNIWKAFAGVKAAFERHAKREGIPVAKGAVMNILDARPHSGMDIGQRGVMRDAVAGRRTHEQAKADDAAAHKLLEELEEASKGGKKVKLDASQILLLQNAITVRTNSADIKKMRELRLKGRSYYTEGDAAPAS